MSITAKELAHRLNISEAAVSMALNNKPGVSTETRKTIIAEAQKCGYDFTRISNKAVKKGSVTFLVFKRHGAVVADTPFFAELTEGIQEVCRDKGYKLNILHFDKSLDHSNQIEQIRTMDPRGMIILGTEMEPGDPSLFTELRIPIVLLDVYMRDVTVDCVSINNTQGSYLATDFLIRRCKCQPGHLRSSYRISNFDERADGFYSAVRTHGLSVSKSPVHSLTPSVEGAYADMCEILKSEEELARAYFADNDWIAIGAMRALKDNGYRIPEDISIVGFDNIPLSNYVEPALTTINVPKKYMGEMAADRLISLLSANHFAPLKIEVNTDLINRSSTLAQISRKQ